MDLLIQSLVLIKSSQADIEHWLGIFDITAQQLRKPTLLHFYLSALNVLVILFPTTPSQPARLLLIIEILSIIYNVRSHFVFHRELFSFLYHYSSLLEVDFNNNQPLKLRLNPSIRLYVTSQHERTQLCGRQ